MSVVITTYKSAQYISTTLASVIAQEGVNIEILIVDDCSSDYEILKNIVRRFAKDTSIYTFQPSAKGHANISRNIGIAKAKYEYVAFLDADDTWNPKHLITSIDTLNEEHWDGCFSQVNLISKNSQIKSTAKYQGDLCHFIFKQDGISVTSGLVIKRELFSKVTFDDTLRKHQDWDFLIRFAKKYRIGQCPYYGLNYTLSTGTNMSASFNFEASIQFMNSSLPLKWHDIFLSNFINKVLMAKKYHEIVNLHRVLNTNYNAPLTTLSLRNNVIIWSAKSHTLFFSFATAFNSIQYFKRVFKRLFSSN